MKTLLIVLLLCMGLYSAETSSSQSVAEEIGVPYIDKDAGQIDSAVLAPDGKSFYTLKGDLITQWQLNPIKKLSSFKIEIDPSVYRGYHIYITPDVKRLLMRSENEIALWDLKTKKLIKKIKEKQILGVMDKAVFITISKKRKIIKWNTENLSEIKSVQLINPCDLVDTSWDQELCGDSPRSLFKTKSKLIYFGQFSVLIIDTKTLKVLKHIYSFDKLYMSYKHDRLYFNNSVWYEVNLETNNITQLSEKWIDKNRKQVFLYNSLKDVKTYSSYESLTLAYNFYKPSYVSKVQRRYGFYDNKKNKAIATFLQFDNSEWVLLQPDGYFQFSSNGNQFLKMRIASNKIVPINSTTIQKFNKNINIKDN